MGGGGEGFCFFINISPNITKQEKTYPRNNETRHEHSIIQLLCAYFYIPKSTFLHGVSRLTTIMHVEGITYLFILVFTHDNTIKIIKKRR